MALVAPGYPDSVTEFPLLYIFFSKLLLFQASVQHLKVSLYNIPRFMSCRLSTKKRKTPHFSQREKHLIPL